MDEKLSEKTTECDQVIVIGSSLTALQLTLELDKKQWSPVLLCTVMPSYFSVTDCSRHTQETSTNLPSMFAELKRRNIQWTEHHWVQNWNFDAKRGVFQIATNQTVRLAKSLVFCDAAEIKRYGEHAKTYSGLFVCPDVKFIATTLEDVILHLQLGADTFYSKLVEPVVRQSMELSNLKLAEKEPTVKKSCCPSCCS